MPPPPPPPPPPACIPPPPPMAPPPITGGGPKSFLDDIKKGVGLKKLPDSLKNDRSAVSEAVAPISNRGNSTSGSGVSDAEAPPSQADIRSKLNCLFGGAPAAPVPAPRPIVQSPTESVSHRQAPPPPIRNTANDATDLVPVLSHRPSTIDRAPSVPARYSQSARPNGVISLPVPPPPPPSTPSVVNGHRAPLIPKQRLSSEGSFESRFTFPDESTFPKPPKPYSGPKTYITHITNGGAA